MGRGGGGGGAAAGGAGWTGQLPGSCGLVDSKSPAGMRGNQFEFVVRGK